MELAGRDAELEAVAAAVAEVASGDGRVLGLTGEAGIGKTGLLASIGDRARIAGLLVLEGRGAEHERDVPFGVVIDALDEHVGTLAPGRVATLGPDLAVVLPGAGARVAVGTGPAERFRYHRALRALLELLARERPVALLLDDLHWADEASVELLLHLLRRPPRGACLLAFASRPGERCTRLLAMPGWTHLPLGRLSRATALELLDDLPKPLRERVASEADGNPMFLRELARHARAGETRLPATLTAAVALDVAALDPAARTLIQGAAVIGDPFEPELAATAAALAPAPQPIDRLVAADLIRATEDGRTFMFRHPLVRRAVYDAAPPAWRLAAHERAAVTLEARGARAAVRAQHVARSARVGDGRVIALLTDAAAGADGSAPATAANWYEAALRLVPDADTQRHARLEASLALALAGAGRLHEARATLAAALERDDPEPTTERLELVTHCAQLEALVGDPAAARRRLEAAFAGAPRGRRAALAFELAAHAIFEGNVGDLRAWAAHARDATADSVQIAGAETMDTLGALWSDDAATAGASLDRAVARLGRAADVPASVLLHLSRALLRLGRLRDAEAAAARVVEITRRTHQHRMLGWQAAAVRTVALWLLLDLDAALREAEDAEEAARLQNVPPMVVHALMLRALVHRDRGEPAEAERAAGEAEERLDALPPGQWKRVVVSTLAATAADRDPERGLRVLVGAAGSRLERVDATWGGWLLLAVVRAAVATGRLEDADRWATESAARAAKLELPVNAVRASCARAEVLLARGEAAGAAELAGAAAATAERISAPLDALEASLLAGRALAAAGDRERAKATLQRVAADAGRGGALRIRDRAARELRRLGTRVSAEGRRAARGPGELTEREREIAELVVRGRSNKQAAAALFLSEGTIENALTRIYAKLGVRSRTQLTGALAPTGRSGRPR